MGLDGPDEKSPDQAHLHLGVTGGMLYEHKLVGTLGDVQAQHGTKSGPLTGPHGVDDMASDKILRLQGDQHLCLQELVLPRLLQSGRSLFGLTGAMKTDETCWATKNAKRPSLCECSTQASFWLAVAPRDCVVCACQQLYRVLL